MSLRTETEGEIVNHKFEVANERYCPDVLIISGGHVTASGNRVVLDDNGSYVKRKKSGRRIALSKVGNIFEFHACLEDGDGLALPVTESPTDHGAPGSINSSGKARPRLRTRARVRVAAGGVQRECMRNARCMRSVCQGSRCRRSTSTTA